MASELKGKAEYERTQEEPDVGAFLAMLVAKLDELGELLQRQVELAQNQLDAARGVHMWLAPPPVRGVPPASTCGRCGNPYGVGGHGPGFCIDRSSEPDS